MKLINSGFNLKSICFIIVVTAIMTSLTTGVIMYNNNKIENGAVDINKDEDIKEFLKVYSSLEKDYYEDFNKTEMIDSAIAGMLEYLGEDYSTYLNKNQTDELANHLNGKYFGIGISIIDNNKIFKVYPDTPAMEVGLQANDLIVAINGTLISDQSQSEVANLITKNQENTLTIQRNNETFDVKVRPKEINNPLTREIKQANGKNIGYIYISSFTGTVLEEFEKALQELETTGFSSLIIDLRANSGGYLAGATDIASIFLAKGKVIYSLQTKDSTDVYKDATDSQKNYPIVILINEGTASASEILTAALKESYGAITIGSTSYGKGKVQETKNLDDGSMIKYTTAKWLTPNGQCIDKIGITPDYVIDMPKDEEGNYLEDAQLNKALEILGNK